MSALCHPQWRLPIFATKWTSRLVHCPPQPPSPSAAARHSLRDYSYTPPQSLSHPLLQRVCLSLPPCELSGKKWKKEPNLRNSVVIHNQWQEQPRKNSAVACSRQTFFYTSGVFFFYGRRCCPSYLSSAFIIYKVITLLLMRSIFSLCTASPRSKDLLHIKLVGYRS